MEKLTGEKMVKFIDQWDEIIESNSAHLTSVVVPVSQCQHNFWSPSKFLELLQSGASICLQPVLYPVLLCMLKEIRTNPPEVRLRVWSDIRKLSWHILYKKPNGNQMEIDQFKERAMTEGLLCKLLAEIFVYG